MNQPQPTTIPELMNEIEHLKIINRDLSKLVQELRNETIKLKAQVSVYAEILSDVIEKMVGK